MRILSKEEKRILSQALWDLKLTPEEFLEIVEGKSSREWPERGFCVARMLEYINWFDIVRIIKPREICKLWDGARKFVRSKSIIEGMDFACRILR
ncbi:MAG: hypothetical protein IT393_04505 [Nitrospirae bacterium]|nr:hypothetical protein [Nitrospirota bacterium]